MKSLTFIFTLLFLGNITAQNYPFKPLITKDSITQKQWVDSIYYNMSLEEKVGQLFMVDVFSQSPRSNIKELIEKYHIGGVIFSKGGPYRQANLTNQYQELANVPLMIAMDAEWGLSMRLDSTYAFPWNMTLGAIKDKRTVKRVAKQIAKHNKRMGVHINFAPVVDINTNPKNPIIGNRSFGEDKYNVTEKAKLFVEAFEEVGVLSSAKHFPGHGDTDTDSHKTLPSILFDKERLDSIELYPFKEIIKTDVSSIMVGHLNVPALETQDGLPTSLSKRVITDFIKDSLNFQGLIFTDALNMKGVSTYDKPGEVDLQAFLAGNDILLISEDIPEGIKKIKKAYKKEIITEERLAHSVKKILYAKYKAGLAKNKFVELNNLFQDLNTFENDAVYMEAISQATTLLKNNSGTLPFKNLDKLKLAYLKMGSDSNSTFFQTLNDYTKVDSINTNLLLDEKIEISFNYDYLIIGHHTSNASPWKSYNFTEKELVALHEISLKVPVILANFSSPYTLGNIRSFVNIHGIIQGYQNSDLAQSAVAQIMFGARPVMGKLPVSVNNLYPVGSGYTQYSTGRLGFDFAENQGIDPNFEHKIDSIVNFAISEKMTPGAQVLITRHGKTIYNKNFGHHTYKKKQKVKSNDLYDLASLTKILVSLPLFMELEEKGEIDLNDSLSKHLPELLGTNKSDINFKRMLSHYARLQAWIPFYYDTLEEFDNYYTDRIDLTHTTNVANNMYIRNDYTDSIYLKIIQSDLRESKDYKYSDLPYYFLKKIIERKYNSGLDYLIEDRFYNKMGISKLKFKPKKYFDLNQIVPTEDDILWRNQLLQGDVHDQGAALMGGIGGHAGLFGNAEDVAKFMLMYLNGGIYGDAKLLKSKTIEKFNTCYYCDEDVRRGVGFDKPQLEEEGPTCGCLSMNSFGHSGFTGTYTWADPDEEIIYVFLSNRIHPDMENTDLITENIRTEIQKVIYDSIEK